jgi:hypothetical protein
LSTCAARNPRTPSAIEASGIATDIRARGKRIQQAHDVATMSPPTMKQMPSGS